MNEERQAKRKEWTERLRNWEESGMSAAAYCRENNIPKWRFIYWKKRLLSKSKEKEAGGFVSFPFADERKRGSGLNIELPSGLRLVVERGFDTDELVRLLKVVGSGRC